MNAKSRKLISSRSHHSEFKIRFPMKSTSTAKRFAQFLFASAIVAVAGCNKAPTSDSDKQGPAQTASSSPTADPDKNPSATGAATPSDAKSAANTAATPAGAAAETIGNAGPATTTSDAGTKAPDGAAAPTAVGSGTAKKQYVLPEAMEHYRKA